ncbi:MAG: DUF3006 domain-containing protein [Selenomonadaceae bacterium]|nr:DUF3006 domain-containing protein [Selenomonadaceae bacterium]MDY2685856.1 DUF3006 domain-containing protein [Selenomonadaceae bacterium]
MSREREKEEKKTSLYLDRFEGDLAVLYFGEEPDNMQKIHLPRACVPEDVADGDYLTLSVQLDAEKTQQAEAEALSLLADDKEKEDGNA